MEHATRMHPKTDQTVDISNNDGETPLNLAAGKGARAGTVDHVHKYECCMVLLHPLNICMPRTPSTQLRTLVMFNHSEKDFCVLRGVVKNELPTPLLN